MTSQVHFSARLFDPLLLEEDRTLVKRFYRERGEETLPVVTSQMPIYLIYAVGFLYMGGLSLFSQARRGMS